MRRLLARLALLHNAVVKRIEALVLVRGELTMPAVRGVEAYVLQGDRLAVVVVDVALDVAEAVCVRVRRHLDHDPVVQRVRGAVRLVRAPAGAEEDVREVRARGRVVRVLGPRRPALRLERVPRLLREPPQVEDEAGDDDQGEAGGRAASEPCARR